MSLTVRLAKIGKKNSPAYKVVVSNTRNKRNGKFLDVLGHFDPNQEQNKLVLDKTKLGEWRTKGALVTKAVEDLVANTYKFVKYNPKADKAAKEAEKAN